MSTKKSFKEDIGNALQQMNGFKIGKWDDVIALVISIGLEEKEWEHIKKNEQSGLLDDDDIKSIDLYFEDKGAQLEAKKK